MAIQEVRGAGPDVHIYVNNIPGFQISVEIGESGSLMARVILNAPEDSGITLEPMGDRIFVEGPSPRRSTVQIAVGNNIAQASGGGVAIVNVRGVSRAEEPKVTILAPAEATIHFDMNNPNIHVEHKNKVDMSS